MPTAAAVVAAVLMLQLLPSLLAFADVDGLTDTTGTAARARDAYDIYDGGWRRGGRKWPATNADCSIAQHKVPQPRIMAPARKTRNWTFAREAAADSTVAVAACVPNPSHGLSCSRPTISPCLTTSTTSPSPSSASRATRSLFGSRIWCALIVLSNLCTGAEHRAHAARKSPPLRHPAH